MAVPGVLINTAQSFLTDVMPEHRDLEHGPPTAQAIERMVLCVPYEGQTAHLIPMPRGEYGGPRREEIMNALRVFFYDLILPWDMLTVNIFQNRITQYPWYWQ